MKNEKLRIKEHDTVVNVGLALLGIGIGLGYIIKKKLEKNKDLSHACTNRY